MYNAIRKVKRLMKNILLTIITLLFLLGCALIEPTTKSTSSTQLTYEQILKENYKGRKARLVITNFVDKSDAAKETSKVGEGMAEMLRNALLPTNRYIVQVRKSIDDVSKGQDVGNGGSVKKEFDLLIEGEIREFNPGIPGAGGETGGASYVTIIVTVINPRTKQILATERVRVKATEFGGPAARVGGALPEIFRVFSKTLMEKAIRMTVEESASLIVAKTPSECYRVVPVVTQKETSKPPPVSTKVTPPPPPPPLRTTQVVWDTVNLRQGPGTKYKVIGNAKKGTSLKIIEVNGDWLRVRLEDGRTAWLNKLATSEAPKPPPSPTSTSVTPTPM
jgi:curli biogenesis system outer membrane secretion channel CsgG